MNIQLISSTSKPLHVIAYTKGIIQGKHIHPDNISDEEAEAEFIDTLKSSIFAPFEFINFVFDFQEVPRAFTHQHVRTRTAAYMQESLRFSTQEQNFPFEMGPSIQNDFDRKDTYQKVMEFLGRRYQELIDMGAEVEDARGILPINIHTGISQVINYRNLISAAEQRLCFQAQAFHRNVFKRIREILISEVHPLIGRYLAPSCSHTGFCSWGGRLDRPCPLQKIYPMKPDPMEFINLEAKVLEQQR